MNYELMKREYEQYNQDEQYREYLKSPKWKAIVQERLRIDNYVCQGCGSRGNALNPLEIHHFRYNGVLYHEDEGDNLYTQLITLCHACHKILGNSMERVTNKDGRRGWRDNPRIPKVNVYTISGEEIKVREENRNE